jgi:hypothetical protein
MTEREVTWHKSSHSSGDGNCVEIGWRKSSYSSGDGDCVEIGWPDMAVAVRDSKNADGPTLTFPVTRWQDFLAR